jgi:WD40 repeat protein
VAFSPDGKRLASGSDDGTVRVSDITTGEQLNSYSKFPVKFKKFITHTATQAAMILSLFLIVLLLDFVVVREIASTTLSATRKTVWSMGVLGLPFVGLLIWLIVRPGRTKAIPPMTVALH